MNSYFKKIILIIGINGAVFTQNTAALNHENVELATAVLRIPCSILEYDLRNTKSRSASFVKALIHANRFVNEMCVTSPRRWKYLWFPSGPLHAPMSQKLAPLWILYDALGVIKNLAEVIVGPSDEKEPIEKADKFQELLGYVVFPLLETAAALGRVNGASGDVKALASKYSSTLIMLSRLGQLYCSAPQTSLKRKIYAVLVLISIIDLVIKMQKPVNQFDTYVDDASHHVDAVCSFGRTLLGIIKNPSALNNDDFVSKAGSRELFRSDSWPEFLQKIKEAIKAAGQN